MLVNKTILITGGGSGIGEALTHHLSKKNQVIICGRNEEKLKKVAEKNDQVSFYVVDVSIPHEIDSLFQQLSQKGIVLDVLFNNAGVVELWDITKTTLTSNEIFEKVNTNLSAAIAITQQFIHQADQSVENFIINNTSEIALMPIPILPLYSASKTGLSVFTRLLRVQLKHTKFKVIELLPPAVDTNMPKQLNNKRQLISPDAFAKNAIKKMAQGSIEYAPGSNVFLFKFFQKFFTKAGLNLMDRLSRKRLMGK